VLDEMALQCLQCGRVGERSNGGRSCTCGAAWQQAALPKRVHDRFDLREWLGAGGMGVVYRALDLTLGRDVAVKTLPMLAGDAADRLMAEARAMASLSHGDVAVLYEVVRWRRTPLLVMEYLPGGTLASRLQRTPRAHAELVALVRVLAGMLGRIHARGVFHGDIKPSNVGFAIDGTPRLLDFGLARVLTRAEDVDGAAPHAAPAPVGGTWAYLSPEVREGEAPGPMLDLWALAVVFCEALLGEHPFRHARTPQHLADARTLALERVKTTCSPAHREVLARLLAPDPTLRPATAAGFDDLLASL
jgi:serine/threonine-protein kinase